MLHNNGTIGNVCDPWSIIDCDGFERKKKFNFRRAGTINFLINKFYWIIRDPFSSAFFTIFFLTNLLTVAWKCFTFWNWYTEQKNSEKLLAQKNNFHSLVIRYIIFATVHFMYITSCSEFLTTFLNSLNTWQKWKKSTKMRFRVIWDIFRWKWIFRPCSSSEQCWCCNAVMISKGKW